MNDTTKTVQPMTSQTAPPHPLLRFVVPVLILGLAIGLAIFLVKTRRGPRKQPPGERVAVVEVQPLARGREQITVEGAGTVVPRKEIPLQARVPGEIIAIADDFVPGGRFARGQVMLEIDPTDYRLTATNRHAELVRARAHLDIERGLQDVARNEWETMQTLAGETVFTERDKLLALRGPQLRLAEAAVVSAQAALDRALLDLERTRVRAPFNAIVRERHVNVGAQITSQTTLARLAGTDAYWVRVTLPAHQVKWLAPELTAKTGAAIPATIEPVAGAEATRQWEGRVLRRLPDLEAQGRQVQLIVEVPRPVQAARGQGELPLGAYVRVHIEGPTLDDVFAIPRRALRENRHVWLLNDERRLDIREVTPIWTDGKRALVRDHLADGDALIVSDISVPVAGMLLRRPTDADPAPETEPRGTDGKGPGDE